MKTLEELRKSLSNQGTYAKLQLSYESRQELFNYVKKLGIENPIDKDQYHATLIYSRKEIPEAYSRNDLQSVFLAFGKDWKIFPSKEMGQCLVLVLDCPSAHDFHEEFMKMGATHDYPEFTPHITISTNYPSDTVPSEIPEFTLRFDRLIVEPLDLEYTYKKA